MSHKRVLSIGQCAADHGAISQMLYEHFAVETIAAADAGEAMALAEQQPFDLILVNRLLDGDGSSGLTVVKGLKADARVRETPVMLVSNYLDAQTAAVSAGALPGFGKAALRDPTTLGRLRSFLG